MTVLACVKMRRIGERNRRGCRYSRMMPMNMHHPHRNNIPESLTADPLSLAAAAPSTAEFIRLPKAGQRDPLFGLSRSYLNYLVLPCKENNFKPLVRSSVLRRRGARTGVRLINVESLRTFVLSRQEREATPNADPTVE